MKRWQWFWGGVAALAAAVIFGLGILSGVHGRARPSIAGSARVERRALAGEREGEREGFKSPATEAVDDKAYPRSYVDDRHTASERRAFDRLPGSAPPGSFRTTRAYRQARAAGPAGAWAELGPQTPLVAPQASQFFDLDTMTGTVTTNSGRITAMAISPVCVPGDCRLWVAAAGGGIWRTNDALATPPAWIAPPGDVPTTSFGSLLLDPNDPTHTTLYAGSGEPNGSGDSEAGLGLFKSTDGGASWALVPGSQAAAVNRSIGAIAAVPGEPATLYIGTAVARHGSASVNGGRRTPPDAPALGVYRSRDAGATWTKVFSLPASPVPPASGTDWFQGGVNRLELDPNDAHTVYAALFGYGLWRSKQAGDPDSWQQIFHTVNQNDFSDPAKPVGDSFGDRTEFDAVAIDAGPTHPRTRLYVGDSSDDQNTAHVWRTDDAAAIAGSPTGAYDNKDWQRLDADANGTNGYLALDYCQSQCGYDNVVASPPGQPDSLWLGGAMAYDELPAFGGDAPRSNGRTVIRSTNAGASPADVTWQDMTQDNQPAGTREGMHPDQHAVVFASGGNVAFLGSDGGVVRADLTSPVDASGQCASRQFAYDGKKPKPLIAADALDCRRLLSALPAKLTSLNDGLRTLQFQSLSVNPADPAAELLGGTQDNGTWAYSASASPAAPPPASQWFESVGGDGGQSGFDAANPQIRYHTYFNATPDVNFHGSDPTKWLAISDPLQISKEHQSFYAPLIADPVTGGRAFIGLEHVWRTDDNGGSEATLEAHCNELRLDLAYTKCGDWKPLGKTLTGTSFGSDRAGQFVVAVERAPGDARTLWAATRVGRLFVSSNADARPGSVKFRRIDSAATPGRFVSGIAIDPADPNHAWVSYSGYDAYTPGTPGHVFEVRYDAAGHTVLFTNRSYNIGDQPVTDIAFDPATGDLYASTDFGVMRRPAGATSWEEAAPGLPRVAVYGITLAPNARVLYAATHGRGAYKLALGP